MYGRGVEEVHGTRICARGQAAPRQPEQGKDPAAGREALVGLPAGATGGHGRGVDPPCQIGLFAKLSILTAAS